MRKFVAVKNIFDISIVAHNDPNWLKRLLLMFDRIAIPYYDLAIKASSKYFTSETHGYLNQLDWLLDQGVAFQPEDKFLDKKLLEDPDYKSYSEELIRHHIQVKEATKGVRKNSRGYKNAMLNYAPFTGQNIARMVSIQLRELSQMDAYPIFYVPFEFPVNQSKKHEVAQITFKALPVPKDSTPLEQIIEYRKDPATTSQFLALRCWMSEVARDELTPTETEEKLEYLLDQYLSHMKLHRMKTDTGTLETIVTTGAEVLGDLVSFKWGKAAQALFSLKRRQIALMEGELTSPGSEVAYIVKARETFS